MSKTRIAGFFYLLVFVTGGLAMYAGGNFSESGDPAAIAGKILSHETGFRLGWVFNLIATACYIVVTALFYELFKPVNKNLSLTAAFFSLTGCATGVVSFVFQLAAPLILKDASASSALSQAQVQAMARVFLRLSVQAYGIGLVFFGFYCLSIGVLIIRSDFAPRIFGIGMLFAGLGWLTFIWQPLSHSLFPYNVIPGMLGEGALTVWLLAAGGKSERSKQQLVAIPS